MTSASLQSDFPCLDDSHYIIIVHQCLSRHNSFVDTFIKEYIGMKSLGDLILTLYAKGKMYMDKEHCWLFSKCIYGAFGLYIIFS